MSNLPDFICLNEMIQSGAKTAISSEKVKIDIEGIQIGKFTSGICHKINNSIMCFEALTLQFFTRAFHSNF